MIAFYQPLLNCFIDTESCSFTAQRVAMLASSRMIIYCCNISTAKNIKIINKKDIQLHEWTFQKAKKFQFCDPLNYYFRIDEIHTVDELIKINLDEKSYSLVLKTKKLLNSLVYWTKFLNKIRMNDGAIFIKNKINNVLLDSVYEDILDSFVKECENILYLENDILLINKKIFQLLNKHKEFKKIYQAHGNSI
jgi:hypothetical protein